MEGNNLLTNKRAVTYSLLAHINDSGSLAKGPLDLFVPIVKKGLQLMQNDGVYKGQHIKEIVSAVKKYSGIDIPIPVMRNILALISKEINNKDIFIIYNDDSFLIDKYLFEELDEQIDRKKKNIDSLQKLFKHFCEINQVNLQDKCVIRFIEKNKTAISYYLANRPIENGKDYTIEARFIEFCRNSVEVYDQIREIYLGAILTSYLEYTPSATTKFNIDLLFDTNFIISLLDLNTVESTHTCRKLIEVGKKFGFTFHVLSDTIDEAQRLLRYKALNFNKSIVQRYVNPEDVYNACIRLGYNKTDLERIADNLEESLLMKYGIQTIPHTETYKNKAKFSKEYNILKTVRSSLASALHDAMCIKYVQSKRGEKKMTSFDQVNCWWVNNAISHDVETDGIFTLTSKRQYGMPEAIKVDDLLNILWLSSPNINIVATEEILEIGLTSLIAFTLNQNLPKARIVKELDDNIQKYKSENITDKDVLLLSTRIANGQIKDLEEINKLADEGNTSDFNRRIKEEAEKQKEIERRRDEKLSAIVNDFQRAITDIQSHKKNIDKKYEEKINDNKSQYEGSLKRKQIDIHDLSIENKKLNNKIRKYKRKQYINKELLQWRKRAWCWFIPFIVLFLVGIVWLVYSCKSVSEINTFLDKILTNKILSICFTVISLFFNGWSMKILYDRYQNQSNIKAFISRIEIPESLKEIE